MFITKFVAIVVGIFLSPALPDGMIEIGKTPCEEAMAIIHQNGLQLVDAEYVAPVNLRVESEEFLQQIPTLSDSVAVFTLSYDRVGAYGLGYGIKHPRTKAGFLLCGIKPADDGNKAQ